MNSLIYPAFLIVLAVVMIAVILTYVIPKFGELYADLNTPLPVTTRVLIATSNTIRGNLILIVPVLIGAIVDPEDLDWKPARARTGWMS